MTTPIFPEDETAATYKTDISGWVSRAGNFWGKDERMARWEGATHLHCDCGAVISKVGWTICDSCKNKRDDDTYNAMPAREWNGETPVCLFHGDQYFWSLEEFLDWCDDEEVDPHNQQLVHCVPVFPREIDADYWWDDLPEDHDIPDDIAQAVDALNAVLKAHGPISWTAGKERAAHGLSQ